MPNDAVSARRKLSESVGDRNARAWMIRDSKRALRRAAPVDPRWQQLQASGSCVGVVFQVVKKVIPCASARPQKRAALPEDLTQKGQWTLRHLQEWQSARLSSCAAPRPSSPQRELVGSSASLVLLLLFFLFGDSKLSLKTPDTTILSRASCRVLKPFGRRSIQLACSRLIDSLYQCSSLFAESALMFFVETTLEFVHCLSCGKTLWLSRGSGSSPFWIEGKVRPRIL